MFFSSPSQTLTGMSEYCSPLLEGCRKNRQHWKCLAEECEKGMVKPNWCDPNTSLVFNQHKWVVLSNLVSHNFMKLASKTTNEIILCQENIVWWNIIFVDSKRETHFPSNVQTLEQVQVPTYAESFTYTCKRNCRFQQRWSHFWKFVHPSCLIWKLCSPSYIFRSENASASLNKTKSHASSQALLS